MTVRFQPSKLNELTRDVVNLGLKGIWRANRTEWEYVASSGTNSKWCFGNLDSNLNDYGWHAGNQSYSNVVGQKPNEWGIMDIYGNVSKWCEDDFTANYNDKDSSQDARIIVGSDVKVHRR